MGRNRLIDTTLFTQYQEAAGRAAAAAAVQEGLGERIRKAVERRVAELVASFLVARKVDRQGGHGQPNTILGGKTQNCAGSSNEGLARAAHIARRLSARAMTRLPLLRAKPA